MHHKLLPLAWIGLALAVLAAAYLWRPITIYVGDQETRIPFEVRAPLLRVGEALYAAQVALDPDDQVTPPLQDWIPLDGKIRVERAVHVTLWENGQTRPFTGFASSLKALLEQAGVSLGPADRILWNGTDLPVTGALEPGKSYVFQIERARTLNVIENGKRSSILSSGPTLISALWDGGISLHPGDWLSVDPGAALPAQGASLALQRARQVTIAVAGQEIQHQTAAAAVSQALQESGISLQGLDYSIPSEEQPVPADGKIRVVRVTESSVLVQTLTRFTNKTQPDPNLELDQRRVLTPGQYGVKVSRYRVRYEDGKETGREPDAQWTVSEPKDQVVGIGTKAVAHTLVTGDGKIEYWRAVTVYATAYSPCHIDGPDHCSSTTASGRKLTKGIIAVSQAWYSLMAGQRVYIPGYGFGVIADTGYGIPGQRWIDLGYDDSNYVGEARSVTLYFLTPIPANVPWSLP